jgi:two-component system, cell cycle response regulator PopA
MSNGVQARVLIVARDDSLAGPLAAGLDRLGWRTITARGEFAALAALSDLQIEAAIVDLHGGGPAAPALAARLKEACAPRRLPVIAIGDPNAGVRDLGFDLTLTAPLHPAQAAMRLETLVRTAVSEEEIEVRLETFLQHGRPLQPPQPDKSPLRILAVGEPAPQFLALSNALVGAGVEIVGAFTAFTAFDYLHERSFDAVVLWSGDNPQEALSITAGMRRNTRLYHTPALVYMRAQTSSETSEAYHRGASDVASPDTPETETARRVIELAQSFRQQKAVRQSLERVKDSGLLDAATGLFTRELFAAHLVRVARASRLRHRPLSVCVLKISDSAEVRAARGGGWLQRATPQMGSMIGRLIRVEDTAARLGPEVFAIALPATSPIAARAAGERIAAVIGCTAFEAGGDNPAFVAEFDIGVAEVTSPETAGNALEAAARLAEGLKAS